MNAPSALVLLLGNRLGFLIALALGGASVTFWYLHQDTVPWFVLPVGLLIIVKAWRARSQYTRYCDWRRAAEEISGVADMRRQAAARRRPALIALASAALWVGCIWWMGTHSAGDATNDVAALLWLGVSLAWLMLAARGAWRWNQRRRAASAERRARDHVVTVAVPAGSVAATPEDAGANLPDYAKDLLKRQQSDT